MSFIKKPIFGTFRDPCPSPRTGLYWSRLLREYWRWERGGSWGSGGGGQPGRREGSRWWRSWDKELNNFRLSLALSTILLTTFLVDLQISPVLSLLLSLPVSLRFLPLLYISLPLYSFLSSPCQTSLTIPTTPLLAKLLSLYLQLLHPFTISIWQLAE